MKRTLTPIFKNRDGIKMTRRAGLGAVDLIAPGATRKGGTACGAVKNILCPSEARKYFQGVESDGDARLLVGSSSEIVSRPSSSVRHSTPRSTKMIRFRLFDEVLSGLEWSSWEAHYDGTRGQPPIHPRFMAATILYGLCRGIRSRRKLEEACRYRLDFMWLVEGRRIDHTTLAKFRTRFAEPLREPVPASRAEWRCRWA